MADYRAIIRYFPAAQDYLQQRKWVRRGDVLAYAPEVRTASFSTDEFGFRHTRFQGQDIGLGNIEEYDRVGLTLGSSHLFGFGLAGNDEILPSQLSELLGYPVFGVAYLKPIPGRSTAPAVPLAQFSRRIGHIVLLTGGDFIRYCYTETADPLFGPSMLLHQRPTQTLQDISLACCISAASGRRPAPHWLPSQACGSALPKTVLSSRKSTADVTELACGLGRPGGDKQSKRFASHRRHAAEFGRERHHLAETLKLPLICYPEADQLLFIDEFHYRAVSQRLIAERLAEQIG